MPLKDLADAQHWKEFIQSIMTGVETEEGYTFFVDDGDGKLARNCISQALEIRNPHDEEKHFAMHINFMITPKCYNKQRKEITFYLEKYHITARSMTAQKNIAQHGPSQITAEQSVHAGINNSVGSRQANIECLARLMCFDNTLALQTWLGKFTCSERLIDILDEIKTKILGNMEETPPWHVTWDGDASVKGR